MRERLFLIDLYKNSHMIGNNIAFNRERPHKSDDYFRQVYEALEYGAKRYDLAYLACAAEHHLLRSFIREMSNHESFPLLANWQRKYRIIDRDIVSKASSHVASTKRDIKDYNNREELAPGNTLDFFLHAYNPNSRELIRDHYFSSTFFDCIKHNYAAHDFHRMLGLYAYDQSLYKNFENEMSYMIGLGFLKKDTSIAVGDKIIKDSQSKGLIPPEFELYEKVADILDDLSWIKVDDTQVMKTLTRKQWTGQEIVNEGVNINNLMQILLDEQLSSKKSKQNKSYFMEIVSTLKGHMSSDLQDKCDRVVYNILSNTRHPISKDGGLTVRICNQIIENDAAHSEEKMAAQLHVLSINKESDKLDRFGLNDKTILRIMGKILPTPKKDEEFRLEFNAYNLLGMNSSSGKSTARQKKVSRHNIESDLGI